MKSLKEIYQEKIQNKKVWLVKSSSQADWYWKVQKNPQGKWICDCPGFKSNGNVCRHIWEVLNRVFKSENKKVVNQPTINKNMPETTLEQPDELKPEEEETPDEPEDEDEDSVLEEDEDDDEDEE